MGIGMKRSPQIASLSKVDEIMDHSDDLTKVNGLVARLLRALCKTNQRNFKKSNQEVAEEKRPKVYSQFKFAKIASLSKINEIMHYSDELTI